MNKPVTYIDLEYVRSCRYGKKAAVRVYYHKHKTDPDVIVRKRIGQRKVWLMGNVKVEE
ncbi:MAG: hypothetical protein M0Q91_12170 [Methanoregula sp.]|jgi:hypothetical protein|nr:hypothetical protein [Methanoregula sp.]